MSTVARTQALRSADQAWVRAHFAANFRVRGISMASNLSQSDNGYPDIESDFPASDLRAGRSFEQEVREKICVRPPYFKLADLAPFGHDGVQAHVLFESPSGIEKDERASAEVGRHLAILGSCALARNNPRAGRHYYLATEGLLTRHRTSGRRALEPMIVRAKPDGNQWSEIELMTPEGELDSTLRCRYQVLPERLFARLFKGQRATGDSSPGSSSNPYTSPAATRLVRADATTATSLLQEVTPAMCLGHFEDYPAMPVAILMDALHRLACEHASTNVHPRLRLISAKVHAERLAFAGEPVEFSVFLLEQDRRCVRYRGAAIRHGDPETTFGTIELLYELLPDFRVCDERSNDPPTRRRDG